MGIFSNLERKRQENGKLIREVFEDRNRKIEQIYAMAKRERGVNFVLTDKEKQAIDNIEEEFTMKKDELIERGKNILEELENTKNVNEAESLNNNSKKERDQKELFESDLKSIRENLGESFVNYKEDTGKLNKGGISYVGKTQKEITADYQAYLSKIDNLKEEGKIDMKTATKLKQSLYRVTQEYNKKAAPSKEETPKKSNTFAETLENLNATDEEFADYVKRNKESVEQELEQGLFGKDEDKKYDQKVEKTDDNYVM